MVEERRSLEVNLETIDRIIRLAELASAARGDLHDELVQAIRSLTHIPVLASLDSDVGIGPENPCR